MRRASSAESAAAVAIDLSYADARHLALELAGAPGPRVDPIAAGVVLEVGETVRRSVDAWLTLWLGHDWSTPRPTQVLISDRRLLARLDSGELASLWWGSLAGFTVELAAGRVVLDYGDGRPRSLSGPGVTAIAVAGVASLYGIRALLTHPGLEPLRQAHLVETANSK